jgi:phage portal protein BeeE
MKIIKAMRNFQDNFFNNGAVPGLVLKSPNTLSEKIKERMIQSWSSRYNPASGGRRPLILDGGIEVAQGCAGTTGNGGPCAADRRIA